MRDVTLEAIAQLQRQLISVGEMVQNDTDTTVKGGDHIAVIKHYDHLRIAVAKIKEAREALAQIEERLSRETVPEVLREQNIKTITVIGVGRVTVSSRWSASMLDKDAGINWLKNNGFPSIVQETVNAQTLAATAKNLSVTEGRDLPSDIFKVGMTTYTSITKAA